MINIDNLPTRNVLISFRAEWRLCVRFRDDGCDQLCAGLRLNERITTLSLNYCELGPPSGRLLADTIPNTCIMCVIYLSHRHTKPVEGIVGGEVCRPTWFGWTTECVLKLSPPHPQSCCEGEIASSISAMETFVHAVDHGNILFMWTFYSIQYTKAILK